MLSEIKVNRPRIQLIRVDSFMQEDRTVSAGMHKMESPCYGNAHRLYVLHS